MTRFLALRRLHEFLDRLGPRALLKPLDPRLEGAQLRNLGEVD